MAYNSIPWCKFNIPLPRAHIHSRAGCQYWVLFLTWIYAYGQTKSVDCAKLQILIHTDVQSSNRTIFNILPVWCMNVLIEMKISTFTLKFNFSTAQVLAQSTALADKIIDFPLPWSLAPHVVQFSTKSTMKTRSFSVLKFHIRRLSVNNNNNSFYVSNKTHNQRWHCTLSSLPTISKISVRRKCVV